MNEIEIFEDKEGNSERKIGFANSNIVRTEELRTLESHLIRYTCIERIKSEGTYAPEDIAKHIIEDMEGNAENPNKRN